MTVEEIRKIDELFFDRFGNDIINVDPYKDTDFDMEHVSIIYRYYEMITVPLILKLKLSDSFIKIYINTKSNRTQTSFMEKWFDTKVLAYDNIVDNVALLLPQFHKIVHSHIDYYRNLENFREDLYTKDVIRDKNIDQILK